MDAGLMDALGLMELRIRLVAKTMGKELPRTLVFECQAG